VSIATAADAVSDALPVLPGAAAVALDLTELRVELEEVAREALCAKLEGMGLDLAVRDGRYPALAQLHRDLRDAMFMEIPAELRGWVNDLRETQASPDFGGALTMLARTEATARSGGVAAGEGTAVDAPEFQAALAELLIFESVRLRLLGMAWSSEDFERLGGEEEDVDAIAWEEVAAWLHEPWLTHPEVRPLQLMFASASVSLAHKTADRAQELRVTGSQTREELNMRAKLRAALRELRLPESVLLENALSALLGQERVDLTDLQASHPVALAGMSRQAMDQRVSRGRRALTRAPQTWPRRRHAALFDLLRERDDDDDENA